MSDSSHFFKKYYGEDMGILAECGLHAFQFSQFFVSLSHTKPFFKLGDHENLLKRVACSQHNVQVGYAADRQTFLWSDADIEYRYGALERERFVPRLHSEEH